MKIRGQMQFSPCGPQRRVPEGLRRNCGAVDRVLLVLDDNLTELSKGHGRLALIEPVVVGDLCLVKRIGASCFPSL